MTYKTDRAAGWWLIVLIGYLLATNIGILLIAPTGPGSSRICYIVLLVYSLVVATFGTRLMKVLAAILAIGFIMGIVSETRDKARFRAQRAKERAEVTRQHAFPGDKALIPANTECAKVLIDVIGYV